MTPLKRVVPVFLAVLLFALPAYAQVPSTQTAGGTISREKQQEKAKALQQKVEEGKPQAPVDGKEKIETPDKGPFFKVTQINVVGATILSEQEIKNITGQYEGKDISLRQAQKVADLITDEYRKKGYVTSRAYIPPQKVTNGVFEIRVIEGKLGNVKIEGNKYFKSSLLDRQFERDPQGYFDYSALQRSLVSINESPDRKATATLVPGEQPGTTDVIVKVKDRMPIHVGFEYDNWGSRYIDRDRYSFILEDNNLLGFDDKLYLKYQWANDDRMDLRQFRYLVPITRDWDIGIYAMKEHIRLGKELNLVDARGDALIFGAFTGYTLISNPDLDLRLNAGFDYKRIRNYMLGDQTSRDPVRLAKVGADIDVLDPWGRNIILPEFQYGIPDLWGGMARKNDPFASRLGAGGKFEKGLLTYYRLQELPYETSLLWKNYGQYSNNILVASEEFQIGGPTSVRGYGPGEFAGDSGIYTSPELSVPFYFVPKEWKVPYNQERVYDTTRFVLFYDFATVKLNSFTAAEEKYKTLRGYGFGFRFNLRDNLTFRVEVGYPLGRMPSDGDHAHPWVEFTAKY